MIAAERGKIEILKILLKPGVPYAPEKEDVDKVIIRMSNLPYDNRNRTFLYAFDHMCH